MTEIVSRRRDRAFALPSAPEQVLELAWGAATDVGRRRTVNEDSVIAVPGCYAVADGLGGHSAGDLASDAAVDGLHQRARSRARRGGIFEPGDVGEALVAASADIAAATRGVAYGSGTTGTTFHITTFDDIAWKRGQSGSPVSNTYWFTVVQPNAGSASAALEVSRVEWYPTPGATPPTLNYWYRRKWVDLTSDTDVAKVPTWMELLLVECVRVVALGSEKGDTGARLSALMSGPLYAAAASEDARLRPDWNRVEVVADGGLKS